MNERLRTTSILAVLLATGACAGPPAVPVFEPDPMLHAPGGRIVFNRMCADEEPYRVKAYARMESPDGRARAVAAVLAGYRATGGKTVFVDVLIQRLKLDAGTHWRNANYTIGLTARSEHAAVEGREVGRYVEGGKGEIRFTTGDSGTADWITFVEPDNEDEGLERFHRFAPELDFTDRELKVNGPQDEFDLTLLLRNETNGRTLSLAGPRVRICESPSTTTLRLPALRSKRPRSLAAYGTGRQPTVQPPAQPPPSARTRPMSPLCRKSLRRNIFTSFSRGKCERPFR